MLSWDGEYGGPETWRISRTEMAMEYWLDILPVSISRKLGR